MRQWEDRGRKGGRERRGAEGTEEEGSRSVFVFVSHDGCSLNRTCIDLSTVFV